MVQWDQPTRPIKRSKSNCKGTTRVFYSIEIEMYSKIEKEGKNSIIVVDDLMHEMSSNADIGKLFTKGRSQLNCNVILLWQNVFPKGPEMRNLSINAQHIVIFKNPCDKSQIRFFAQQVAPGKVTSFLNVCNDCTKKKLWVPTLRLFTEHARRNQVQDKSISTRVSYHRV